MRASQFFFLALLLAGFVVGVVFGIWNALTPPPPYNPIQLRVSARSGPFSRDIFVEPTMINELLVLPNFHRTYDVSQRRKIFDPTDRLKGTTAKLALPNSTIFLPSATSLNQTLTFLPMAETNPNSGLQAKLVGQLADDYFLRFSNMQTPAVLVSEPDGLGGFQWIRTSLSTSNLLTPSEGGGFLPDELSSLVNFFTQLSEYGGALESLYDIVQEWLNGDPPPAITDQSIIDDVTQVIETFIVQQQAAELQTNWDNLQIPLAITIPTTVSSLGLDKDYRDSSPLGDPHGVLAGGEASRATVYTLSSGLADADGATGTYTFANTMIQFSDALNFSNTTGQPTQPSEYWMTYAQAIGYYIYMIQLAALYDNSFGVGSTYPSPWTSARLQQAQDFLAGDAVANVGLAHAYELYYQFLNQFQANFAWEEVPTTQSSFQCSENYCYKQCIVPLNPPFRVGCTNGPPFYSLVNNNGPKLSPPNAPNTPSCAFGTVPSNVVGSADGQATYTCQTSTDSAALALIRQSYTEWLENFLGSPRQMLDAFAQVAGLSCTSQTNNTSWTCTKLPSTYVEGASTITSGFWFGRDNGSASTSLTQNGVHLYCSVPTSVTMLTQVRENYLFEVQSFSTFSQSAFDNWNPSFTTDGGCCPFNTSAIRTCWEGSITESVGSQSAGVLGRRDFWCVTDSVNNNVTTSTDAVRVSPCGVAIVPFSISAGLYPFAQTPTDMADFSCFFMPSRAQQWYFSSTVNVDPYNFTASTLGHGWGTYNLFPAISFLVGLAPPIQANPNWPNDPSALPVVVVGGAAEVSPLQAVPNSGGACTPYPESQSNKGGVVAPLAAQSGFPTATTTAAVPQLMAYAFPVGTSISGNWIIPTLTGTNAAVVSDGTKSVQIQSVDAINAILSMPQPNFAASFSGFNLWGMPSPSATTATNPWVVGTSIVFWDQTKTILPPGTTVSASSSVTAIVLENVYTQLSGTAGDAADCGTFSVSPRSPIVEASIPAVLQGCFWIPGAGGCGVGSVFNSFNWSGYSDASVAFTLFDPYGVNPFPGFNSFTAPTWSLAFIADAA